jgi:outer membrane lipopolysaccharide assembly protein LptE/RlpB
VTTVDRGALAVGVGDFPTRPTSHGPRPTPFLHRRHRGEAVAAVLALAAALGLPGCGYHLIGLSSNLPARLTKLHVAPLVNQTTRAELDQRLTEQITQEWVRRGRFQLVSQADQADAVLSGRIVSANVMPVRFDSVGRASEYQLQVTADIQLVDRTGEKPVVLWHDAHFSRSTSYQVDVNATNYFDRDVQAIEQLALDFARGLVVTILEGF